jgi:hypothetical protein
LREPALPPPHHSITPRPWRYYHYGLDPQVLSKYPSSDLTIEQIGDLLEIDVRVLLAASRNAA